MLLDPIVINIVLLSYSVHVYIPFDKLDYYVLHITLHGCLLVCVIKRCYIASYCILFILVLLIVFIMLLLIAC